MRTAFLITAAALAAVAGPVAGQTILARAEVNPRVVMVGEPARYAIRFLNADSIPSLATPQVDGLEFSGNPGTSSFTNIVNGRVSIESELSWAFRATRTGSFTIPGGTVRIGAADVVIPAATVEVVPMDEETRSRALLKLELPDPPWYVGQALPARLSLLVRRDLILANVAFPQRQGDGFLNSEFDNNPARGTVQQNGRSYDFLSWEILITPIKAGPAGLGFSQEIALQFNVQDSRFPGFLGMSRARTETYRVSTDALAAQILPLPAGDRPDAFQDAIGDFSVRASLSARDLTVGEPVTLELVIEGEGNFERIPPPALPEWENWRIYPPKSGFSPSDKRGYSGTKTFSYILIPQADSISEVPAIPYATFDPREGSYRDNSLPPQPVTVKPSAVPLDSGAAETPPAQQPGLQAVPERILPLRPGPGRLHPTGSVLWNDPRFWIGNLLAALAALLAAAWVSRHRRLQDDQFLARRHHGGRAIRRALQKATAAAAAGQPAEFFAAARFALQERLSHFTPTQVEAKTLVTSDCMAIMGSRNMPVALRDAVERLLHAADAHQFAGLSPDAEKLRDLEKDLLSAISGLNRLD